MVRNVRSDNHAFSKNISFDLNSVYQPSLNTDSPYDTLHFTINVYTPLCLLVNIYTMYVCVPTIDKIMIKDNAL